MRRRLDGPRLYFAYGSNLDADQMRVRCPDSRPLYPAILRGHRLAFSHFSRRWGGGAADIRAAPDLVVHGVVYEMGELDFAKLDRFEAGYARVDHRVHALETDLQAITTYHVLRKRDLRPSRVYLEKMLRWGRRWGFPDTYLEAIAAGGVCDEDEP